MVSSAMIGSPSGAVEVAFSFLHANASSNIGSINMQLRLSFMLMFLPQIYTSLNYISLFKINFSIWRRCKFYSFGAENWTSTVAK
jgi:hypothetical protein